MFTCISVIRSLLFIKYKMFLKKVIYMYNVSISKTKNSATSAAVAALWNATCAVKWKLTSGKHLDVPAEQLLAQLSSFYFNMEKR